MGDWEAVRKELGVAGLGLPMPAEPYDSLREIRAQSKKVIAALKARHNRKAARADQAFADTDYIDDDSLASDGAPLQRLEKIGRNDPCSCGSGKKYKKCCGRAF
jgi:SEC-C motif domain protein